MESFYIISGGRSLNGELKLKSAKNSVLVLMAAALLSQDSVVLKDIPTLTDIVNKIKIIKNLGAKVSFDGADLAINARGAQRSTVSAKLASLLRSSFVLLGPLLARHKKATIYLPGGCDIGARPVDIHIDALQKMGVIIKDYGTHLVCNAKKMTGAEIEFSFPSVGATQNIMMAATRAKGKTIIKNAAREPEIKDLQDMLNLMGAKVEGAGTSTITIHGHDKPLNGVEFEPIPDRIVAGTLLIATATIGGNVRLENCRPDHLGALIDLLQGNGCVIDCADDAIDIKSNGYLRALPDISTAPYPSFPTDLQPQIAALASTAYGTTRLYETVFEKRLGHFGELAKMGADIRWSAQAAVIRGVGGLRGAKVKALDLRSGAALVIAALKAKGISVVENIHFIDRGYENLEGMLQSLGADIVRVFKV